MGGLIAYEYARLHLDMWKLGKVWSVVLMGGYLFKQMCGCGGTGKIKRRLVG